MIDVIVDGVFVNIKQVKFPAGELHLSIQKSHLITSNEVIFVMKFEGSDDLVNLMLLNDIYRNHRRHLHISYVPFGRQDRAVNEGEANSLRAFAKFINNMNFELVMIDDPHSDVVEAVFERAEIKTQFVCFQQTVLQYMHRLSAKRVSYDVIVSPDMGASKKTQKIAASLQKPLVQCFKQRHPYTGEILGVGIVDSDSLLGKNCLIVDDICDGGRTFIEVAKALKAQGASGVDLYVTHGIFSKGITVFDGIIENVFCYNNMNKNVLVERSLIVGETK